MRPATVITALLLVAGVVLVGVGGAVFLTRDDPDALSEQPSDVTESTRPTGGSGSCSEPDFWDGTPEDVSQEALPVEGLTIETSSGPVEMRVEVADDPDEQSQGLMFRESLGEGCGMIFVYPGEQELSFWMRNTLIPLSIAYIDGEGEIVDLQDMEALDDEPPNYTSAEPARYALEANVGFFEENGVEVGDTVIIPE